MKKERQNTNKQGIYILLNTAATATHPLIATAIMGLLVLLSLFSLCS